MHFCALCADYSYGKSSNLWQKSGIKYSIKHLLHLKITPNVFIIVLDRALRFFELRETL